MIRYVLKTIFHKSYCISGNLDQLHSSNLAILALPSKQMATTLILKQAFNQSMRKNPPFVDDVPQDTMGVHWFSIGFHRLNLDTRVFSTVFHIYWCHRPGNMPNKPSQWHTDPKPGFGRCCTGPRSSKQSLKLRWGWLLTMVSDSSKGKSKGGYETKLAEWLATGSAIVMLSTFVYVHILMAQVKAYNAW